MAVEVPSADLLYAKGMKNVSRIVTWWRNALGFYDSIALSTHTVGLREGSRKEKETNQGVLVVFGQIWQ